MEPAFRGPAASRAPFLPPSQASVGPTHTAAVVARGVGGVERAVQPPEGVHRGRGSSSGAAGTAAATSHVQRARARMLRARLAAAAFARGLHIKLAASAALQRGTPGLRSFLVGGVSGAGGGTTSSSSGGPAASAAPLCGVSSERRRATERMLTRIRDASVTRPSPARLSKTLGARWWDGELDDALCGAQAAAAMLQTAWRRHLRLFHRRSGGGQGGGPCGRYAEHHDSLGR